MKTRTTFVMTLTAALALSGAAVANSNHGKSGAPGIDEPGTGGPDRMQMMMDRHAQMMDGGTGKMERRGQMMNGKTGKHGRMMDGGMGSMSKDMPVIRQVQMIDRFGTDGDGTVIPVEAREGFQSLLEEYDADSDGSLSIAEFEAMHSALIRESMVDRFQFLDDDGDGQVTVDEIVKPADIMSRMQSMRERMMQGGGMMQGGSMGPGNGMDRADSMSQKGNQGRDKISNN